MGELESHRPEDEQAGTTADRETTGQPTTPAASIGIVTGWEDTPADDYPAQVVTDPVAAEVLTDPTTLRQLAPFLGRALSVAEVARETGEKPNTTLKRVRRFVEQGLLEVVGERKRAGRPVKLYRTVAAAFFVPFEATHAESLEAALKERDAYWERLLRRNVVRARSERLGTWGTRFYRDARGHLQVQMAVTPNANATTLDRDAPAALSLWRDQLTLDFEDAKRLQHEMFKLALRYQRRSGAQRYVLRMGLAPVLHDDQD